MNKLFTIIDTFLNIVDSKYHISIKKDWEEFNSEPINPEQVKSEPINPEPINPEPINTEQVKYEHVKSEPINPEHVKSEPINPEQVKSEPINPEQVKYEQVKSEPIKNIYYCIYEFIKKPKKGEVCGTKIKSGEYCYKHKKKEEIIKEEIKEEKILPDEKKITISLNKKLGKFIHSPSKLAFYSKENKVVYGKLSCFEDKIVPLCDKDIEVCKKYMFKYDMKLIS
jgi:hypothetical protein